MRSSPGANERDVSRSAPLRLRFSDYLLPSSVLRQSVWITPTLLDPIEGKPVGSVAFTEPVYDPYDDIVVYGHRGTHRWFPSTRYFVKLLGPQEDGGSIIGFRGLDGAPLVEEEDHFSFVTGDDEPSGEQQPPLLGAVRYCEGDDGDQQLPPVAEVFARSCARAGCHGSAGDEHPAVGLDLSSFVGVGSTAIGVVAVQTERGAVVGSAQSNAKRFGDRMPRIDPKNAAGSYLVYKLLINPRNYTGESLEDSTRRWLGDLGPAPTPSAQKLQRLRDRFVAGRPMPLGGSLRAAEMRAVVRWVLQGARVRECH